MVGSFALVRQAFQPDSLNMVGNVACVKVQGKCVHLLTDRLDDQVSEVCFLGLSQAGKPHIRRVRLESLTYVGSGWKA